MRLHCLQHVPFEGPALIADWAQERGHDLNLTRFYENSVLPSLESVDGLVVMGGPMGVYDEEQYPWLVKERALIGGAIRAGKKVLGICLGAQLIAHALGTRVFPNSRKEVGWFPIDAVPGEDSPLFAGFPSPMTVFHWHGDTFDLPPRARHLFQSKACRHQAFSHGTNVLGLQFHLEVSEESLLGMLDALPGDLRPPEATGEAYAFMQDRKQILAGCFHIGPLKDRLYLMLDRFFGVP